MPIAPHGATHPRFNAPETTLTAHSQPKKRRMSDGQATSRALLMTGDSVGLSVMVAEDVPIIARWHQDLEFTARIGTPGDAQTREMRQAAFDQISKIRPDSIEFAVIELASGRLIGLGGLFDITRALAATLFVGIGEDASRGKGYGTEATRLICEYGFFFRYLHCIKVEVHAYNMAACRMYERVGFKLVGRLRGANLLNNRRYDDIVMDLLRSELQPRHIGRFQSLDVDAT
jgi:RimJ/RimL family protein N-acetyltransferase